jgi:pimeloyl-ACP methyl ester carboxylesterase
VPIATIAGLKMYYEIHGEGEPLVLILGLGSDVSQYSWMIDELSRDYRVIALDNRGAGRSDKPRGTYTVEIMTDDVAALMSELAIDRARILGISLGSRMSVDLAVRHPEKVRCLMLVSVLSRRLVQYKMSPALRIAYVTRLIPRFKRRYRQPWYAYVQQHSAALNYDCLAQSHKVHVPTLIMHGKADQTASFRGAEELHLAIPESQLVAFEGGHLFFRSAERQAFFDTIRAYRT